MRVEPASDLFSMLSDELLCSILSNLQVREAVRCSVLSRRWRFLYTQIPRLTITPHLLLDDDDDDTDFPVDDFLSVDQAAIAKVENIISNILLMHSSDLEAFHLEFGECWNDIPWAFSCENVWKWVWIVARKNVQHLTLSHDVTGEECTPPAIFCCTRLRTLKLFQYTLSLPPNHFNGFNHLVTCIFELIDLTDDSLALFTSHCPLLQKLTLCDCFGLRKPIISAANISHLQVSDGCEDGLEVLTVNCLKLQTMHAYDTFVKRVNGLRFYELSGSIKEVKMECGSNLIEVIFNWDSSPIHDFPAERFVEIMGSFKSLKSLDICIPKPLPLLNLLERLPNLKRLSIGGMSRKEVIGRDIAIPPCLGSPLANLRMLVVNLWEYDGWEISFLGCLLQSTPALETMKIQISGLHKRGYEKKCRKLSVKLKHMRRASSGAKISVRFY